MSNRSSGRAWHALIFALLFTLGGWLASASPNTSNGLPSEQRLWSQLRLQGAWLEGYEGLERIARVVDLVVLGRIASVEPGRTVEVDGDVIHFVNLTVEIHEQLGGRRLDSRDSDRIVVEQLLPDGVSAESLELGPMGDLSIYFLRTYGRYAAQGRSAGRDFDYYFLPTPDSVITSDESGRPTAPFAGGSYHLRADVEKSADFDDLVDRVRVHASKSRIAVDRYQDGSLDPTVDELATRDS